MMTDWIFCTTLAICVHLYVCTRTPIHEYGSSVRYRQWEQLDPSRHLPCSDLERLFATTKKKSKSHGPSEISNTPVRALTKSRVCGRSLYKLQQRVYVTPRRWRDGIKIYNTSSTNSNSYLRIFLLVTSDQTFEQRSVIVVVVLVTF